jgi:hypothetical protein
VAPVVLRIIFTPLLAAGCTLATRKWGATLSGWIMGLPLLSGPVSILLLLEYGPRFAQDAARGTLLGFLATGAFCLTYVLTSKRAHWWVALISAYAACVAVTASLSLAAGLPLGWALGLVTFGLAALAVIIGRPGFAGSTKAAPRWDLPVRMAAATVVVLAITAAARYLGAEAAGLLAPIPIVAAITAAFTHREAGSEAVRGMLGGTVVGSLGGVAFFAAVVLLVRTTSPALAYGAALAAAAVTGVAAMRVARGIAALRTRH